MTVTLKVKLISGVVSSFVLIAGLGFTSYTIAAALSYQLNKVETLAVALRNHTVGDMLHDGLRADVYAALFAASAEPGKKETVITETHEHAQQFREVIEKNRSVSLPAKARAALDAVDAPLQAYIESAEKLVAAAFSNPNAVSSMLEDFDQRFTALESAMETAGDQIQEVTEQQTEQAHHYERMAILASVIAGLLGLAVGAALIWIALRETLRPLNRLQKAMQILASGDHQTAVPYTARSDEIGSMAHAIEVFRLNAAEREKLEEAMRSTQQKERRHQVHLQEQVTKFKGQISEVLDALTQETSKLRSTAGALSEAATIASTELGGASQASSGVAENSQAVATATEQLGASIREISCQAQRSRDVVHEAAKAAEKTDSDVLLLAEGAQRIESVVMLIRSIAEQTNLLALNATIEAARAGESGKGFAVVASEVKQLASQTSKATEDIANQIGDIQGATTTAIESIRAIVSKVTEIEDLTSAIAAAVEEQEAATNEIARNVSLSAEGSQKASTAVDCVTATASRTSEEAQSVSHCSDKLAAVSNDISGAVNGFISAVDMDLQERRTAMRYTVERATVLTQQHESIETMVLDLSLTGIRIKTAGNLAVGQKVKVDFGTGPTGASVVWTNSNATGLKFDLALKELPKFTAEQPERHSKAA